MKNEMCSRNVCFALMNDKSSQKPSVDEDDPSMAVLLEKHRHLQSEILTITDLLCKKREEIKRIKEVVANKSSSLLRFKNTIKGEADLSYPAKFQCLLKILKDLKNFACSGIIDDDVLHEFVAYLKLTYPQVLIVDVEHTRLLIHGSEEDVRKILNDGVVDHFVDVILVLKNAKHYSVLAYNPDNSIFFHHCLNGSENIELAEQLVLRMRHYLNVVKLLHISPNSTPYTESSLYAIENMMKIIWNGLDDRLSNSISVDQFLKLPSHPDELNVIVANNYAISKIKSISDLAISDNDSSDNVNKVL